MPDATRRSAGSLPPHKTTPLRPSACTSEVVAISIRTGPLDFRAAREETARQAAERRRCETAEWTSDRGHERFSRPRQKGPITVPTEQTVVVSTQHNRQILERFDALLGAEDLDELDELCNPDMVNHALAPDRPAGLAGTREFLETQGRHQMTGQYWDKFVVVAEGDYIVQFGRRGGDWPAGTSWGFGPRLALTFATSPRCTASRMGRSPSGGPFAMISGC